MDTPGVGEPLRLRNVPSRPDYEVPTRSVIDYLETRSEYRLVPYRDSGHQSRRILRAPFGRIRTTDQGLRGLWRDLGLWRSLAEALGRSIQEHLRSVLSASLGHGDQTMEEALDRVKEWTLADVSPWLKQPFLILHGENDLAIPLDDARKAFAAAGSTDKQLRIFTVAQGGAEHVQADQPDQARQLIADWFAQRLNQTTT